MEWNSDPTPVFIRSVCRPKVTAVFRTEIGSWSDWATHNDTAVPMRNIIILYINTTVYRCRQEFCWLRGRHHRLGSEETGRFVVADTARGVRADHEQRRLQEDGIRRETHYGQHDVRRISRRQKGLVPSNNLSTIVFLTIKYHFK